MSSQGDKHHLQGLQIEDGLESEHSSGRVWVASFIIREAILIAPDNMVPAEELMYFDTIRRFIVRTFFSINYLSLLIKACRKGRSTLQTKPLAGQDIECRTSSMHASMRIVFRGKQGRGSRKQNYWSPYVLQMNL